MFIYFRYLIRLIFCLTILLWAGCLPKGCLGKLGELNEVKPVIKQGTITEHIDPSYEGRTPYRSSHDPNDTSGSKTTKTPKGSKSGGITLVTPPSIPCRELDEIRVNGPEVLLFVDKNASAQGKGTSWPDAVRTITEATKKAMAIQAIELSNGRPPKDIFIIIASGVYDLAHEKAINNLNHNSSIIDLETFSPNYHQHIAFLGGYKVDDTCLENDKNIARRPTSSSDRDVIIDGSNGAYQSNHVVIVSSGHDIKFKDITIKHGHAQDSASPHGAQGGGILLKNSHHIELDRVTIIDAKANTGGGIAIILNSHDITIKDSKIEGCKADDGGGLFIGDTSYDITIDNDKIHNNTFTRYGGGIYIADQADRISLINKSELRNNKPKDPLNLAQGGGLAITSDQTITLDDIIISYNQAILGGGGVFINNTAAAVLIDVKNSLIDNNELIHAHASAKGGGVYVLGPSANVYLDNSKINNNTLSSGHGGGIAVYGQVNGFHIHNNTSITGNKGKAGIHPNGLGIWLKNNGANHPDNIIIKDVTISDNVMGHDGGGLYAKGVKNLRLDTIIFNANKVTSDGAGCYIKNSHVAVNKDHIFTGNHAQMKGGALYAEDIQNAALTANAPLPMNNLIIDTNTADYMAGGAHIEYAPGTIIDGGSYKNNTSNLHGCAIYYESNSDVGGIDPNATFIVRNAFFQANVGGALCTAGVFKLSLVDSDFHHNISTGEGGAINVSASNYATALNAAYHQGGDIDIINTSFVNNEADKGGALYIDDGIKKFTTQGPNVISFANNHAYSEGGAIWAHFTNFPSTIMTIHNHTQFNNNGYKLNTNTTTGGAIYMDLPPKNLKIDGDFTNNKSINNGGAIAIDSPGFDVMLNIDKDALLQNNSSDNGSGGALALNCNVRVRDESVAPPIEGLRGQFYFNKAKNGLGGAVAFLANILPALPVIAPVHIPFKTYKATFNHNEAGIDPAISLAHAPIDGLEFTKTRFVNTSSNPYSDKDPIVMHEVAGDGGLIKITTPINSLVLNFTRVEGFKSKANGGAFYLDQVNNDISLYMIGHKNEADASGGLLYINNPSPTLDMDINGSYFTSNKAGNDGGVFYIPQARNVNIVNAKQGTGSGGVLNKFTVPEMINAIERRYLAGGAAGFAGLENISRHVHNEALGDGGIFAFAHILGNLTINDQVWVDNEASQSGGALSIQRIDGDISIRDPLWALNKAKNNGGALYINQAHDINISSSDVPRVAGKDRHVMQYSKSVRIRVVATDLLGNLSNVLGNKANITALNNYLSGGQSPRYRGQFLLEHNKAQNHGGAIYINNANDITIDKIPIAHNEAKNGSGGGLFMGNISGNISINDSIIYDNKAKTDAAGLYLKGNMAASNLNIADSSIQENIMPDKVRCQGAAGFHGDGFNRVTITRVNFFNNKVQHADTGSICAAAMKIDNINPQPNAFTIDASDKLNPLNYNFDKNHISGNKIVTYNPADVVNLIGTIFIDQAIQTDPNFYITLPNKAYNMDEPFNAIAPGNPDSNEPIPPNVISSTVAPPTGPGLSISHRDIVVSWPGK